MQNEHEVDLGNLPHNKTQQNAKIEIFQAFWILQLSNIQQW